jgi:hypothetical protein
MNLKNSLSKYSEKPSSLFKRFFVTFAFAYLPFLVLFIILAGFGLMPVNFNDENIYGYKAILVLLCFTPFIIFMLTVFAYLWFRFGNFVLKIVIALLPEKKN